MDKLKITPLLSTGIDKRRNAKELIKVLDVPDRMIRAQVERERRSGIPIISIKGNGGGYYLAENQEQIRNYADSKIKEVLTTLETVQAIVTGKCKPVKPELIKNLTSLLDGENYNIEQERFN